MNREAAKPASRAEGGAEDASERTSRCVSERPEATTRGSAARFAADCQSPDEAFVVAHHQLGLDLLHRLDDDGHDDQQARAAEAERRQVRAPRAR